ncbi:MAG: phenyltransferase domain-containing protein [Deltaproteobacteria bacterium]|nr:phenyltransferase domain-containing protein [Deltaproteobacteria bacterium]
MELKLNLSQRIVGQFVDCREMGSFIAGLQRESGEIPWSEGGKTDPWDHIESAMGLAVAGYIDEARRAYEWMKRTQLDDGSWWAAVRDGVPEDRRKDANFSSYMAVGVFHHYLITNDRAFLRDMWPTVSAGIDYALGLQAPTGEIYWSTDAGGAVDRMALLTGSSSIYMSIKCALAIASRLGEDRPDWQEALERLGNAIRTLPNHFNMIKSRYSMDWYYPVLCGAVTGAEAHKRIDKSWGKFVEPGWGVRCVSDRPWATMAETSELVLALAAVERFEEARLVFGYLEGKRYDDGSYWMGVTFPDSVIWPEERTSWTAAAVLLAYDALNGLTPASCLFSHAFWKDREIGCPEEPRPEHYSVERIGGEIP